MQTSKIWQWMQQINVFCSAVSGFMVCCIVLMLSAEVVFRKLGYPIQGVTEFAGFALVGIIFLGLSPCEEVRGHIRVDFLITRFTHGFRKGLELALYLTGFCLYALMTWHTGVEAVISWSILETVPGLFEVPVYPAKTIVPIGCGLICVQIMLNAASWIRSQYKPDAFIEQESAV